MALEAQIEADLINIADSLDSFMLIPGVSNEKEMGDYLFEADKSAFAPMV